MARPREFDTETAMRQISERFWAEGYQATGISELEEVTGLARPRLYAAFGSKQQMLHGAIDFYLAQRVDRLFAGLDDAGIEGVVGFFRRFAKINREQPQRAAMGCLMVNSIVEIGQSDPGVMARAERYRTRVRQSFGSALQRADDDGDIDGEVAQRADLAYIILMGLYVTIKGGATPQDIRQLCQLAVDTVESWRSPP